MKLIQVPVGFSVAVDKKKTLEAFLELIDNINPRSAEIGVALEIFMTDGSKFECPLGTAREDNEEKVVILSRRRERIKLALK